MGDNMRMLGNAATVLASTSNCARRIIRAAFATMLLLASAGASAQSVSFTAGDFFIDMEAGDPTPVEIRTRDLSSMLVGGGSLDWELLGCSGVSFVSPPPSTADASGFTSATIVGTIDESCEMQVTWDHDDNVGTSPFVTSPNLSIFVFDVPVSSTLFGPKAITPRIVNPEFGVRVTSSVGVPIEGAAVEWRVEVNGSKPFFFGGSCGDQFVSDANGEAFFDFDAVELSRFIGDYEVTASIFPFCSADLKRDRPAEILLQEVFNFTIEDVQLRIAGFTQSTPPLVVGRAADVEVFFETTPSGVGLPDLAIEWFTKGISTTPDAGTTAPTDANGRAVLSFTPTSPGFGGLLGVNDAGNAIDVSDEVSFGAVEYRLEFVSGPLGDTFTDEVAGGITMRAIGDFGGGKDFPLPDVPLTFTITSGNALFTDSNTNQAIVVTGGGGGNATPNGSGFGEATSPPIRVGRTADDVTIVVSLADAEDFEVQLGTTPSSYTLQATSPTDPTIDDDQTVDLTVQALRAGISTPQPLGAGEVVTWSISPPADGAVVTTSTLTDANGLATATFDPAVAGTYEVVASFDPGIPGVSPGTEAFTVEVLPTGPVISLAPFSGDLTRAGPGSQFPIRVAYLEDGQRAVPPSEIAVQWSVSFGDATVSPEISPIGTQLGLAGTQVTFGSTPGTVVITASLVDNPQVTTFFYLELLPEFELAILEPDGGQIDLGPGEAFDVVASLRTAEGQPLSGLLQVQSDIAGLGSSLFVDKSGIARLSGNAPFAPGTYSIELRYDGISNEAASKAQGPAPLSEFVTVNVIGDGTAPVATLEIASGDGQQGLVGRPAQPLEVRYQIDGEPRGGIQVQWLVTGEGTPASGVSTTNSEGIARYDFTFGDSPGPVSVTASVGQASVRFGLSAALPGLRVVSGDNQAGQPGLPLPAPLVVEVTGAGANSGSLAGIPVNWSVTLGDGSIAEATTLTGADGRSANTLTLGPETGANQVRASLSSGASVLFNASSASERLTLISGNAQRGPVQTLADAPLVVQLLSPSGVPIANRDIQWMVTGGDAGLVRNGSAAGITTTSPTDAEGLARIGLRFGNTAGNITVQASRGPGTMPIVFTAIADTPGLRIVSGNNQSGEVGQALAEDFVVSIAPQATKGLGGVAINWQVLDGGGTLRETVTTTDAEGQASNRLTLGASAGPARVRASILNGPEVVLQATGLNPAGQLQKVSGDNQTSLPTNTDSAPLVVRLARSGGGVVAGATIRWEGTNAGFATSEGGALATSTTSVTNAQGEARITARVIASGPATVRAQVDGGVQAEPVEFTLQGAIANAPGLGTEQRDVAGVLDSACAALAALPNPTPAQADLLQRCLELQGNPGDAGDALEELAPDVGLTMTGAGLEVINTQVANVNGYLIEARNNPGGGRFKVGVATADGMLPLSFLPSALAEEVSAEGEDLGPDFGRWGFFASGQVGRGKYTRGQRTPDFDYSSGNLTMGADYRVTDTLIIGGGVGFSRHDTDLRNDGGTLDVSGWNVIGYGTWYNERQWFVDGVLSWGSNDYDLRRNIDYRIANAGGGITEIEQVASASTDGDQLGLSLAIGRDWQHGPWSINSYLRGNYLRTEYDAYSETMISGRPGEGLALAVEARDLKSLSSLVGGRATYVMSRDWGILMPHFQAEWEHKFEDDPTQLFSRFVADPTGTRFVQLGDDIDTNTFNVGFGLSALWPGGRSAYLAYERLLSAAGLTQNTLSVGVRIEF